MKLPVAHVLTCVNREVGGPAESVPRLVESLIEGEREARIFALDYPARGPSPTDSYCSIVPTSKWGRTLGGWSQQLDREILAWGHGRPGIVHNHGCWLMPNRAARICAEKLKWPLIISPRGMLEPWAMRHKAALKSLALSLYEKRNLEAAAAFHATGVNEARSIRNLGFKQPIYVIPNGIHPPATTPLPEPRDLPGELKNKPFCLFLSRFHPKKGLQLLIEAWLEIADDYKDWHLALAGTDFDGYQSEILHRFPQSARHPQIHWLGPRFGDEKEWLLSRAKLMVLPTFSENFGQVIAEALIHKTPAITTPYTAWQEIEKKHCGWLCKPETTDLIRQFHTCLKLDPEILEQYGQAGELWMRNEYSWKNVASRFGEMYDHVTGKGNAPDCLFSQPY